MSDTKRTWSIEKITSLLSGLLSKTKGVQSAVSDPSASGTSVTFIDSISQDAQGVITPTKKTVKTMVGATAVSSGAAGLVPQPTRDDNNKFLRGDGTWDHANRGFKLTYPGDNGYTVVASISAADDLSDIKFKMGHNMTGTIPSSNVLQLESSVDDDMVDTTPLSNASVTASEVANRVYPISYDSNGKLCCMVPWESTTTGQCFTDISFSLSTSDWTLSNGVYTATITNALITSGSGIQAFYDSTLRTALTGDVYVEKGTGSATFTTTSQPVGTFTGVIRVLDSVSGVIPVGRGGTGGTTTKTSRAALNVPIRDIPVDFGTVSSLPQTVNDADLTANMVAFDCVFGNPAAIPGGIDVTFAAGSVTIDGTLASGASTSIKFWAHEVRGSVEGTETAQEVAHVSEYVQINPQTLTSTQQAQARTNIGAASESSISTWTSLSISKNATYVSDISNSSRYNNSIKLVSIAIGITISAATGSGTTTLASISNSTYYPVSGINVLIRDSMMNNQFYHGYINAIDGCIYSCEPIPTGIYQINAIYRYY